MKTFIKTIGILALLMGITFSVQAQKRGGQMDRPQRAEMKMKEMWGDYPQSMQRLQLPGLSEDQKEQIKNIHLENQKATLPLRNQLGEKTARMKTLTTAENYNENAVNMLIDEMAEIKAEIAKNRAHTHQQIRMVLTDEQRVIFDSRKGMMKHRAKTMMRNPGKR